MQRAHDEDTTTHAQAHTDTHAHNMRYELQAQGKQANAACAMHSNDGDGTSTAVTRGHSRQRLGCTKQSARQLVPAGSVSTAETHYARRMRQERT